MTSSAPLPLATFSTGQTTADLLGLAQIFGLNPSGGFVAAQPPALTNPSYVAPNRGPPLFAVSMTLLSISILCVFLRLISRFATKVSKLLLEDWAIILALVFTTATTVVIGLSVNRWHFGRHVYDLKLEEFVRNFQCGYAYETLATWSTTFVRISIILFVQRLYSNVYLKMHIACTILIIMNILFTIGVTLAYVFQCGRPSASFNIYANVSQGCLNVGLYYSVTALAFIMDVGVLLLPIRLIWQLKNIPFSKRLEVVGMFSLGLLACAAAAVRFAFLFKGVRNPDFTWNLVSTSYCCQIESNLAIIVACIPAIKVLFVTAKNESSIRQRLPNITGSSRSGVLKESLGSMDTQDNIHLRHISTGTEHTTALDRQPPQTFLFTENTNDGSEKTWVAASEIEGQASGHVFGHGYGSSRENRLSNASSGGSMYLETTRTIDSHIYDTEENPGGLSPQNHLRMHHLN